MRIFATRSARYAWLAMMATSISGVVAIAALTSCESSPPPGYSGDAALVALADREGPLLADVFALRERPATLHWSDRSTCSVSDITISTAVRHRPPVLAEHVRHELLHRMLGPTTPSHQQIINGINVRSIVPSWGTGGE